MLLDRETVYQILASSLAVGLFIGAAIFVTNRFSDNGGMSQQGGFALIGAIVLFIVLMATAGLWLERQDFDGNSS